MFISLDFVIIKSGFNSNNTSSTKTTTTTTSAAATLLIYNVNYNNNNFEYALLISDAFCDEQLEFQSIAK